jgi:hypothetical protein
MVFILDLESELGIEETFNKQIFDKNHEKYTDTLRKLGMIRYCQNCPFHKNISVRDSKFNYSFLHYLTI